VTHHPIRTEPDGTRVYSNGTRYKPKAPTERAYAVRKPDNPRAVRWRGQWLLPIVVLPDEQRVWPETRSDEEAYEHRAVTANCRCRVCMRPDAERWRQKWRRENL
jgi:hypothetical protein